MLTCEELIEQSVRKGFGAVAVTDCWNTYAHHKFYRLAREAGIKPILGLEIQHESLSERDGLYHLTLLAETDTGYENIVSLAALHYAKKNSKYVTAEELAQRSEGIIALTGSTRGEAAQALLHGNQGRVKEVLEKLSSFYGSDNLFLELMNHNTEKDWFICENFSRFSKKMGIPSVVTNNDRFISPDDADGYFMLRSIEMGEKRKEEKEAADEYYLKGEKELEPFFYTVRDAIDLTARISRRCNVELRYGYSLGINSIEDPKGKLEEKCRSQLRRCFSVRGGEIAESLENNLAVELESVEREEISGFLLFLTELLKKCREEGVALEVVGGSLQESFIAYLLGITMLNPLEHGLVFECFCSSDRLSLPQIEFIKAYGKRELIFDIISSLIPGSSIYYQVSREEMSYAKIIQEVCSALEAGKNIQSELENIIPKLKKKKDLQAMLESSPALRTLYSQSDLVRRALHLAGILKGKICHFNMNSSRVFILPKGTGRQITRIYLPSGECFLQCNRYTVDHLGGWTFVLHHSHVLSAIVETIRQIHLEKPPVKGDKMLMPAELEDISLDDNDTFDMISSGDTTGVYLLESRGVRDILRKITPRNFNQLVTALSLYRPAPLEGGLWKTYVDNGSKGDGVELPDSSLAEALKDTRGVLLFIEQVRKIIELSAGLRGKTAFEIERALKTRDSGALMKARLNFIRGAMENGISENKGDRIFDFLIKNIKYTHDKALSCSQAYLTFRSAYMKTHYFEHYFAALLSVYGNSPDKFKRCADYFKSRGGKLLPPDINSSCEYYTAEGLDIRSPLSNYKGIDIETVRQIASERRKDGEFKGLDDFLRRLADIPEMTVCGMIEEGFFDSIDPDRTSMIDKCVMIYKGKKIQNPSGSESPRNENSKREEKPGQFSLFDDE